MSTKSKVFWRGTAINYKLIKVLFTDQTKPFPDSHQWEPSRPYIFIYKYIYENKLTHPIKDSHSFSFIRNSIETVSVYKYIYGILIYHSSIALGNVTSRRSRSHRRSAMAAAAPIKRSASSYFSPDSPPKLVLSPDQYKYCSEALRFFKEKLPLHHQINREFAFLQVFLFIFIFSWFTLFMTVSVARLM